MSDGLQLRLCTGLLVPDADDDLAPCLALLERAEAVGEPLEGEDLVVDDRLDLVVRE